MNRTVLVLVLCGLSWLSASSGTVAQVAGDANGDSIVNVGDVVYEVSYLYKNGPLPVFYECGDPTGDCIINVGDIVYLVSYLFKEGPAPQIVECGWSEPINLGTPINSDKGDYCLSLSLDWEVMVLGSERTGTYGNTDLWYSVKDTLAESWPEPVNCGANVNTAAEDLSPCVSPDGRSIYFNSWERAGGYGGWDIWVSAWDSAAGEWGLPENQGPNVNTYGGDHTPFISFDGGQLYFVSFARPPGGMFVSEWTGSEWGVPTWLGENVHENYTEEGPCVTADGSALYFARWVEGGVPHLFVSYWTGSEWGPALELPPQINYPGAGAWDPWIAPDGSKLYFTAGLRPGGLGRADIWVSERIPVLPEKRLIDREGEHQR